MLGWTELWKLKRDLNLENHPNVCRHITGGSRSVRRSCDRWDEAITRQLSSLMGYWLRVEGSGET